MVYANTEGIPEEAGKSEIVSKLGRYQIGEEIGRSAWGIIYKGYDPILEREVVVKSVPQGWLSDVQSRERFFREAQAAARLYIPSLQRIYDIGEHKKSSFVVFELSQGKPLNQAILEAGRLGFKDALDHLLPVAMALDYAHEHYVIHRGIKPSEILTAPKTTQIAGLGFAWKEVEQMLAGQAAGVFNYFSPEQVAGVPVDHRTDIYSFGAVFYEMVTGMPPFRADNAEMLIQAHHMQNVDPPSHFNTHLTQVTDVCILRAMEKNPDKRYQTMRELIEEFTRIAYGEAIMLRMSSSKAKEHVASGNKHYKDGKLKLAIEEWAKAVEFDPYDLLTHNSLGAAYWDLGQPKLAVREYQKTVDLNQNNLVGHHNLGCAQLRLNDLKASIEHFKKAVALHPKFVTSHYHLGNALAKSGKLQEARQELEEAVCLDPQYPGAHFSLGCVLWQIGEKKEAQLRWKRAFEMKEDTQWLLGYEYLPGFMVAPELLLKDDEGRLHSKEKPALIMPGGFEVWAAHGINIKKGDA